jgi:hypothetical protein
LSLKFACVCFRDQRRGVVVFEYTAVDYHLSHTCTRTFTHTTTTGAESDSPNCDNPDDGAGAIVDDEEDGQQQDGNGSDAPAEQAPEANPHSKADWLSLLSVLQPGQRVHAKWKVEAEAPSFQSAVIVSIDWQQVCFACTNHHTYCSN